MARLRGGADTRGVRTILALLVAAAALAAPAAAARSAWHASADARCGVATRESKRLVATVYALKTQQDVFRFLRSGVAIQARLTAGLRAAGPPDAAARRFVALLARSADLDRRTVARLEQGVSRDALQGWMDESNRLDRTARQLAGRIGLRACARYLDPETYK
jgi:hypothetical protein